MDRQLTVVDHALSAATPIIDSYSDTTSKVFLRMGQSVAGVPTNTYTFTRNSNGFLAITGNQAIANRGLSINAPIEIAAEIATTPTGGDPAILEALQQAHEQIVFLANMVNDLSTLSRAERGKLTLEISSFNAHQVVASLVDTYQHDAQAKGLSLRADISPHLETLSSSELYVREILQNFITNAIKYTEKGSVIVGAKPKGEGIVFTISDTGIGISKADQERVFDKFFRSEDFRTRATNGTGLGLYVTMKLARLIHADISLSSELNRGSTFSIFVPNVH
jgi:signal transduction histidine kinase